MSKGILYIVRNPLFPTLFKIGFTTKNSIEERKLDNTSIPEAFEEIRKFKCDNVEETERLFHETFDSHRYYSQLDGRGKRTEFFSIVCLQNAVKWMDRLKGLTDATDEEETSGGPKISGGFIKGPGVIATIIEVIDSKKGQKFTLDEIHDALVKRFPFRNPDGMLVTVRSQVPRRLERDRGYKFKKNADGSLSVTSPILASQEEPELEDNKENQGIGNL